MLLLLELFELTDEAVLLDEEELLFDDAELAELTEAELADGELLLEELLLDADELELLFELIDEAELADGELLLDSSSLRRCDLLRTYCFMGDKSDPRYS